MYRHKSLRVQILLTIRCVITANEEHSGYCPKIFSMLPLATLRVHLPLLLLTFPVVASQTCVMPNGSHIHDARHMMYQINESKSAPKNIGSIYFPHPQ